MSGSDSKAAAANGKPHAICIPCPYQSHIKAMLNLAKLLHHTANFRITFVNTDFSHRRLLKSRGPDSLAGTPDFRFESIPDGLPPSDLDASQSAPSFVKAVREGLPAPFLDLVAAELRRNTAGAPPPVTCIVSDLFISSVACAAGEELGIPVVALCTISACALLGTCQYRPLMERGYIPLKDSSYSTNGCLDTIIDGIPGMKNLRLRDLPTYFHVTDADDLLFKFVTEEMDMAIEKASALIINTFEDLEREALEALAPAFPHLYAVGPIHSLLDQIPRDSPTKSIGSNLWVEESGCLPWLDSKAPNSVVYVNFGSVVVMTPEQLMEFAWGLAGTNFDFLWVIRPNLVAGGGGDSAVLTPEFEERTRGRVFVAKWCPQEQVLNHASIGLFLTHSGWNSTLESLSAGVPMICWPCSADQSTNCRYSCVEWGVGKEMERDVKREVVERLVREAMEGEEGMRMRERATEWRKLAAAAAPNGAAAVNLGKMVEQLASLSHIS